MKKTSVFILFSIISFTGLFAQQSALTWSSPVAVADGSTYGSMWPKITIANGNPVIMWGNSSKVYVARWTGSSFSAPVQVSPVGLNAQVSAFEGPQIAAQGNTVFVTFATLPTNQSKVYIVKSIDGGMTFGDTVRVDQLTSDIPILPELDIIPGGDPIVAFIRSTSTWADPRQVTSRSWDGGSTFDPDVDGSTLSPGDPCECCFGSVIADGSDLILLYRNNDSNIRDIYAAVSTDGGNSYNSSTRIDFSNWNIAACPSTGPKGIVSGDSLIAVWMTGGSGPARVNLGTFDITTEQAGYNMSIDNDVSGTVQQNYPAIAGNGDTIGVAWQDNRNIAQNSFFKFSVTGTSGFGSTHTIVDTAALATQVTPDIAFNNGLFYMVYRNQSTNQVMYRTATVTSGTGIEKTAHDPARLMITPNPFHSSAVLSINNQKKGEVDILIFDVSGRLVRQYREVASDRITIEKGNLGSGIYQLQVMSEYGNLNTKLIIQ